MSSIAAGERISPSCRFDASRNAAGDLASFIANVGRRVSAIDSRNLEGVIESIASFGVSIAVISSLETPLFSRHAFAGALHR